MYKEFTPVLSATKNSSSIMAEPIDTFFGHVEGRINPNCRFYLDLTAVTGTPTGVLFELWGSVNGTDFLLGAFTSKTVAVKDTIVLLDCPRYVKVKWTFTGGTTPTATFAMHCTR